MAINKKLFSVAYLSMEIALENNIKTYSGGLGVLAGDILRSAANKKFPLVGVTLLSRQGYFKQGISSAGDQIEQIDRDYDWSRLKKLDTEIRINIGTDQVKVGVWQYLLKGRDGFFVPVYLLDTAIPGNKRIYQKLTDKLYGGNLENRLRQEIVFGRGGVKILEALGYQQIKTYHLNEGHGALAAIELFNRLTGKTNEEKVAAVKAQCVFTTHTPIKTSYDNFPVKMVNQDQPDFPTNLKGLIKRGEVNMMALGRYFSRYVNGVARSHQQLLNKLFPEEKIAGITNGVDSLLWTSPEFKKLYDKFLPGWQENPRILKLASKLSPDDVWRAHQKEKRRLLDYIKDKKKVAWSENVLTICFARRFTEYKRPLLIFSDLKKLLAVLGNGEKAQLIFAGKAHPRDLVGQAAIKKIHQLKRKYPQLKLVFLENYNLDLAKLLVAGSDLWLSNPLPPQEASATSGMKAAHNGVPQISTLDGWWLEGYHPEKTGWAITDEQSLYKTLETKVLPLYYASPQKWRELMVSVISLNASYFNTSRVLDEYIKEAYQRK